MPADSPIASDLATIRIMGEGGRIHIPTDSGWGSLNRPSAEGDRYGRIATLETLWDFWIDNVPDPDTALAQDPDFDEKLKQHPDVRACSLLRELTVASMPVRIEPSKARGVDADLAQKIADYVEEVFEDLPRKVDLYRQMQNAVLMGGQGHEWIWRKVNGVDRPIAFHPIHKTRFMFDRLGNMALLTRNTPVWGAYVSRDPVKLPTGEHAWHPPLGKFMYHKYTTEGGTWIKPAFEGYSYFGRGEDTNLYIPVTFDMFVLRFRMKWLEKHGMPLTVLYHPDDEGLSNEVLRIANSLRGESIVTIPRPASRPFDEQYHLEFVEPPASGEAAFENFSENWTKPRIEKILLGGANLLSVGQSGSYGATVAQRDAGATIIFRYDAQNIDETINTQLIPHICWARWPGLPARYFPKHNMVPEDFEDRRMVIETLAETAQLVPVSEKLIYDAAGIDAPKDDEKAVFLGQPPAPPGGDEIAGAYPPGGGSQQQKPGMPKPGGNGNGARGAAGKSATPLGSGKATLNRNK